mmetsp:Transcript_19706/g.60966  ORF Transcript_19706/g.60966 Transcript_19706/m.60966 type:complete len:211 (-) Transcript_19706:77-709(-)
MCIKVHVSLAPKGESQAFFLGHRERRRRRQKVERPPNSGARRKNKYRSCNTKHHHCLRPSLKKARLHKQQLKDDSDWRPWEDSAPLPSTTPASMSTTSTETTDSRHSLQGRRQFQTQRTEAGPGRDRSAETNWHRSRRRYEPTSNSSSGTPSAPAPTAPFTATFEESNMDVETSIEGALHSSGQLLDDVRTSREEEFRKSQQVSPWGRAG